MHEDGVCALHAVLLQLLRADLSYEVGGTRKTQAATLDLAIETCLLCRPLGKQVSVGVFGGSKVQEFQDLGYNAHRRRSLNPKP